MFRRRGLGALVGVVAVCLAAGVGGALALQRARPPGSQEVAVHAAGGEARSAVADTSTSLTTLPVPTTAAPTPTTSRTTATRASVPVPTTGQVSRAVPTTVATRPLISQPATSTTVWKRPITPPSLPPMAGCVASPSTVEVAYSKYVPVRITFSRPMAGAEVAIRDGGPDQASGGGYGYATVDASGYVAVFQVGVAQPRVVNGVPEPYGTPHTFYLDAYGCSVRVIPH